MREHSLDPMDELRSMQERLSRIMGEMNMPMAAGERGVQVPHVDIREHGNEIIVTADMPGVSKDDISIDVKEGNVLEISARKKMESQKEEKGYIRHERGYSKFYRSISLPSDVDRSKAKATYNNGVLEITLPVTEKHKAHGIPIS
ncbi:Hsp20/alpha crystallin family protein [Methanocella sp. MCL-LM]|uniref:Hsp20/alpha crystallin family protein n=1 Tax=Methanocella sp. MCL-LM TaxID=3412035 RepID=UPI003C768EAA